MREKLAMWGLLDRRHVAAAAALSEHLDAWSAHLAAKGTTPQQQKQVTGRARRAFDACGFLTLTEIDARRVEQHLRKLRERKKKHISVRTANAYVQAARQFTGWAVRDGLLSEDPLRTLGTQGNPETDRRLERRALTVVELRHLLATTQDAAERHGLDVPTRALIYALATSTGLRRNEIITLRIADLDLADLDRAAAIVRATNAKNRRLARQPLPSPIAERLREFVAGRNASATVFRLSRHWRAVDMLRADLAAAEIDATDPVGRAVDFHALRTTFGTNLARAGVPLQMAQKLMRHSDPRLTANIYTIVSNEDRRRAVGALPDLADVLAVPAVLGSGLGSTKRTQADAVRPSETDLASKLASPAGLEPATYGLGNPGSRLETAALGVTLGQDGAQDARLRALLAAWERLETDDRDALLRIADALSRGAR